MLTVTRSASSVAENTQTSTSEQTLCPYSVKCKYHSSIYIKVKLSRPMNKLEMFQYGDNTRLNIATGVNSPQHLRV